MSFNLYDEKGDSTVNVEINFKQWNYHISHCTAKDQQQLSNVPGKKGKTWEISATTTHLKIKCNSDRVLNFDYADTDRSGCLEHALGKKVVAVKVSKNDDKATSEIYFEGKVKRAKS